VLTNADLPELGRQIVDTTYYLTLATADSAGVPWASPVYFAPNNYREFYWMSSPDVTHSQNLSVRPGSSIVIYDSGQAPGGGRGVYFTATAGEVPLDDLDSAISIYNGRFENPDEHGLRSVDRAILEPPAAYRLYRAIATEASMLCRRPPGQPCPDHGLSHDHRTPVTLW
jgi:hypothetical protein